MILGGDEIHRHFAAILGPDRPPSEIRMAGCLAGPRVCHDPNGGAMVFVFRARMRQPVVGALILRPRKPSSPDPGPGWGSLPPCRPTWSNERPSGWAGFDNRELRAGRSPPELRRRVRSRRIAANGYVPEG